MRTSALVNNLVLTLLAHGWLHSDRSLVGLAVRGRRSGKLYRFPVQYARNGDELLVVPAGASRKSWWRNLRAAARVCVLVDGRWKEADGEVVLPGDSRHAAFAGAYARRWPKVRVESEPVVRLVLGRSADDEETQADA
jgi:deazaflavin-dependent oxidoreductase (nitroreductase family)